MTSARETLDRLIRERGDDFAGLSRMLGRNAAYVQQFIRRGVPKKLDEEDRRTLARYFGVPESLLGGPEAAPAVEVVAVPRLALGASAGPGAIVGGEEAGGRMEFDRRLLRELTPHPDAVSLIKVKGDSMAPTLEDGDDILVDGADGADAFRDGVYVLRLDDALVVKRLARAPQSGRIAVLSDNAAYPSWPELEAARVAIVGRVVWVGKRLR